MKNISNSFSNNWNNVFNKDNSVFVESGTKAITEALTILNSKFVAIPTYTCERVLKATLDAGCKPYVTDCDYDLQINVDDLKDFKGDTVIVPHMFGIKAKVKEIKRMGFNVVEDCSQAMGFDDIGKYSDVVVSSTGGGCKWLSLGTRGELCGGGIVSYDGNTKINWWENCKFMDKSNAWMRAMYFTDNQKRIPYTPIHDLYGNFNCPIVDKYKNKLDWISIHI